MIRIDGEPLETAGSTVIYWVRWRQGPYAKGRVFSGVLRGARARLPTRWHSAHRLLMRALEPAAVDVWALTEKPPARARVREAYAVAPRLEIVAVADSARMSTEFGSAAESTKDRVAVSLVTPGRDAIEFSVGPGRASARFDFWAILGEKSECEVTLNARASWKFAKTEGGQHWDLAGSVLRAGLTFPDPSRD